MRHTVVTLLKSTILLFIVINAVVKVSRHSNLDVDQTKSTGKVIKCLVVITYSVYNTRTRDKLCSINILL